MTAADKALHEGSRHSTIAIGPTIGLGEAAATAGVINHWRPNRV
jgi:hypothetical protein